MLKLILKGLPLIVGGAKVIASLTQGTDTSNNARVLPPLVWKGVQFGPFLATHEEADIIQTARATGMETPGAEPVEAILYRAMKRAAGNGLL